MNTSLTAPPSGPALAAPASGSSAGAPAVRCGCRASRCAERGVHRLALRAPASQAEPGVADKRRGRYWQLPCGHCPGRIRAGWPLYRRPLCRGQHALLQGAAQGAPDAPSAPGGRGAWLVTPWRTEGRPPGMSFGSAIDALGSTYMSALSVNNTLEGSARASLQLAGQQSSRTLAALKPSAACLEVSAHKAATAACARCPH